MELVAEAYLDSKKPDTAELEQAVENMVRETAGFLIKNRLDDHDYYTER